MIFQTQQMLFFSLNENLVKSFERYVSYTGKEFGERAYFKLARENNSVTKLAAENSIAHKFEDPAQLLFVLEEKQPVELANLILIIDIYKSKEKKNFRSVIQDIVVQYPEVKILFISFNDDWVSFFPKIERDSIVKGNDNNPNSKIEEQNQEKKSKETCESEKIDIEIKIPLVHSFNPFENNALRLAVNGKVNLFDSSNLRNYLKQNIFASLKTHTNYPKLQKSRTVNLTLAIDEERHQTFFNSYALYKYRFRALPITTFNELYYYRANISKINNNLKLIFRDYDLQFEDYDEVDELIKTNNAEKEIKKENILENLRGCSKNAETGEYEIADLFWNKFRENDNKQIYFVSRISAFDDKNDNEDVFSILKEKDFSNITDNKDNKNGIFIDKNNRVFLRGINKPVDGFQEFCDIEIIKMRDKECRDDTYFDIKRNGKLDSHSVSPKILHIGEALLKRSKNFFDNKMFIVSAVLAQEALEVLNGFHFLVMLDAIYQKAISETHIETESIGIKSIGKGAKSRFQEIKLEVKRICRDNQEAEKNVLSQIFNDIRHIYKENEQFEAADEALREFITVNHSLKLQKPRFICKILSLFREKKIKQQPEKIKPETNLWITEFGWPIIPFLLVVILSLYWNIQYFNDKPIFPIFLFSLFIVFLPLTLFVFRKHPISLVYLLVGRTLSLTWLFFSFLMMQVFFFVVYYTYINYMAFELPQLKDETLTIAFNTIYTGITTQCGNEFNSAVENNIIGNTNLYFIILIQIFMSWVYLGIFISTLYQKLRQE